MLCTRNRLRHSFPTFQSAVRTGRFEAMLLSLVHVSWKQYVSRVYTCMGACMCVRVCVLLLLNGRCARRLLFDVCSTILERRRSSGSRQARKGDQVARPIQSFQHRSKAAILIASTRFLFLASASHRHRHTHTHTHSLSVFCFLPICGIAFLIQRLNHTLVCVYACIFLFWQAHTCLVACQTALLSLQGLCIARARVCADSLRLGSLLRFQLTCSCLCLQIK